MDLDKPYKSGQKVAAQVNYEPKNPRKLDWILAVVVKYIPREGAYVVNDLFPENRKLSSWTVPSSKVVAFPDPNPSFFAGDKVLSLWYLPDVHEWSSMFYEGTIAETPKVRGAALRIRFRGDDAVSTVKAEKVVKMPYVEKKRKKKPLNGEIIQVKKLKVEGTVDS
mmetsp:Transcript_35889/g.58016  ORF Transcript_35889/g.58016 Transcript_35889/m.58016 type:complete len:166 (+) Transcript_35889:172-669(+)|eukprot:CAMPEP_0184647030 /NCGR_PEP_ID=MMETSP0308-20130426/3884_1 /TAXON_ID=38269 /ORGANISM="Gloeochaete witrockiana, Strain SAG 46.84" /LENGTH=165 /DNA_ID=CAMNT_0027077641 /DNA_START=169 /DNA_END=666 /DNA_ORIENTATION=-